MSKEQRQQYIRRVTELQNRPELQDRDHLTICGFFTTAEEFERHPFGTTCAAKKLKQ